MQKPRRKMGRPALPPEEVRNIRVEIRLSKVDIKKLERVSKGSLSTWIREQVLKLCRD